MELSTCRQKPDFGMPRHIYIYIYIYIYIQDVYIICVYLFQIDQSQLNIYWSSFVDVEAYGHSSYHSGILKYEYGIGM